MAPNPSFNSDPLRQALQGRFASSVYHRRSPAFQHLPQRAGLTRTLDPTGEIFAPALQTR